MAFWGNSFIFAGIPSETYNLYISSPDGGMVETTGAGDVVLLTETVFNRPKPYLLGVQQSPVLSYDVQFTSPDELMAEDIRIIEAWLFGQTQYQKLQIMQYDMEEVYFNCFITQPKIIKSGNTIKGISGTVVCDAPFAWAFPRRTRRTYTGVASETIVLNNVSDNNNYEYPSIVATVDSFGGDFSIVNETDANREFAFTGLTAGEVLTVNNELSIITSSLSLLRLANFNLKWFRLLKGINTLTITGHLAQLDIIYNPARKMA